MSALSVRPYRPVIETLEDRQVPSTFTVTTTADAGPGSLRQAILDADNDGGPNAIGFALPAHDHTITPTSQLPNITTPTTVDGRTQVGRRVELLGSGGGDGLRFIAAGLPINGEIDDLIIRGFGRGVYFEGHGGITVAGCKLSGNGIGLDLGATNNVITGNRLSGNATGILFDQRGEGGLIEGNTVTGNGTGIRTDATATIRNNTVDSDTTGMNVGYSHSLVEDNTVVGNSGNGISVYSGFQEVRNNLVEGNGRNGIYLDYDGEHNLAEGNTVVGNGGDGIVLHTDHSTVRDNQILNNGGNGVHVAATFGSDAVVGNTIARSGLDGVRASSEFTSILQNSISDSGNLGIEYNANYAQVAPVLNSAILTNGVLTISGGLDSAPNTTLAVEFFANDSVDGSGNGEGQTWLLDTTVKTDAAGHADFTVAIPFQSGGIITATATNANGSTSEFSGWVPVVGDFVNSSTWFDPHHA